MKGLRTIFTKRHGTVALELGAVAGRVALAPVDGDGWQRGTELPGCDLDAAGVSACREALTAWVRAADATGLRCRITLGASFFRTDTATLPGMTDQELASSARFEAIDRFGLDESRAVIQHALLGASEGRRSVLLLAASLEQVRRAAEIAMEAGLLPEAIEHAALAAARGSLRGEPSLGGEIVATLHVEASVATLAVWKGGDLAALRSIQGDWSAASQASEPSSHDLDTIPLEPVASDAGWRWSSLAEETLRCLRQACGEASWPSCLAVSGAAAAAPDLVRAVGGVCGLPTVAVDCARWSEGAPRSAGPEWAPVMGSMLGTTGGAVSARRAA